MSPVQLTLIGLGTLIAVWLLLVGLLYAMGRRSEARALATFIPDCLAVLRRLLADPRVSRGRKLILLGLVAYMLMPFDLVPDFLPLVGVLDDAIIAALALRIALRAGGPSLLREHWRGSDEGLALVMRVAYGAFTGAPSSTSGSP